MSNKISLISLIIYLLASCASKKNVIYFQDSEKLSNDRISNLVIFQKDDFLSITVFGVDENTSKLFNTPQLSGSMNKGYSNGSPSMQGYLIDSEGEIDFPVIGKIKIAGLNRNQAIDSLKSKLKDYIKNPVINFQIQNFKITILGEVKNPGTYTIPNERLTLIEALGLAGDLTINAVRKNIKIIREENGMKNEYIIDIRSKYFLNSPLYYLKQNDIVYVTPNQAKINSSNVSTSAGVFISVSSLIITTFNALTR